LQLYSRYIFNKTLVAFAGLITIFICLIWFSRAITFVKYVTENGVKLSQFFYLFALILPWLLLFIIPVSLFVAILLIYNRLIYSNEITILKNSGITKARICFPIIMLAMIGTFLCFLISFYLMPAANKELRISRVDLQNNYSSLAFTPQTFETLKSFTIYAKKRDQQNNLAGILLHDQKSSDYSLTITAKDGNIAVESNSAVLYMNNGTIQKFNYKSKKTEILHFDSYVFNLTESQKSNKKTNWKPKELYLWELLNPSDEIDFFEREKYLAEIHQRFTYPLLPLMFALIAASCVLRGNFNRRGNLGNIILAILMVGIFLAFLFVSYDLITITSQMVPFLYLIFALFFCVCLKMLKETKQ
jgi:lipopolysaccharide export system permease protein